MKKIKNIKEKIENNIFFRIGKFLLYTIVVILLIVIIVQRTSNKDLGGFRVYMIASGSMNDEYKVGDILISKKCESKDIIVGDDVTYLGEKGDFKGRTITHRVIKKYEKDGVTHFVTKGIANMEKDPEITYDNVIGKVVYKTVILSFFGRLMTNSLSYYILFMVVGLIVSIEIVSSMFDSDDEKEEDERRK